MTGVKPFQDMKMTFFQRKNDETKTFFGAQIFQFTPMYTDKVLTLPRNRMKVSNLSIQMTDF